MRYILPHFDECFRCLLQPGAAWRITKRQVSTTVLLLHTHISETICFDVTRIIKMTPLEKRKQVVENAIRLGGLDYSAYGELMAYAKIPCEGIWAEGKCANDKIASLVCSSPNENDNTLYFFCYKCKYLLRSFGTTYRTRGG